MPDYEPIPHLPLSERPAVERMNRVITSLLEEFGLDPDQVWGTALTELIDLGEEIGDTPIEADESFSLGFALGAVMYADREDGGVGPAPEPPYPSRSAA